MRFAIRVSLVATLTAPACSQDTDSDSAGTGDDADAGHRPPSADTIWRIEPEPTLILGWTEEQQEQQFYLIRGATRLSTGVIVVLDGASRELRAFSPDGTHLWTAGGPGDAPGEMGNDPSHLERLPGDILQVQDGVSRIRYGADGGVVADELLAVAELQAFGRYFAWECRVPGFVGDRVLACSGGFDATRVPSQAGPWRGETELAVLPWDMGSIDRLGVFLAEEAWALPPEEPLVLPEGITVLGGSILGHASPPGAAWEAAAARSLHSPEYLREHLPPPDSIPNVDHLVVDDPGMVWVGSYRADAAAPRLYDVYDPAGRFVARVTMPGGVEVVEIGVGHVLGIARDELDVERIVLLDLTRG